MNEELGYTYRHVYHILSGKGAKIGGVPFLTIPQGVAMIGGLSVGMMSKNIPLGIILIIIGYLALSMYQGEFALLRTVTVVYTAALVRLKRPKIVSLEASWNAVRQVEETQQAAVLHLPGADLITGKS